MSTTDVDWELKEGKLYFHGNLVKEKNFKEFNFLKKDFKSTISKKEEAQFLHQRFKILAHVLKETLSQNFYESTVNIAHPKPTFSDWTDSQWLGFSRKGTFLDDPKDTIQFQVTIHPKDKQNNVLHVDLWLDGKANETRLRMLDQIKNNREMFSEILKNIPGTYFIGIQKSHDDKELVEISKINPQFIENIIGRLTKKGTEFFIRKYYSEDEAINPDTKIINNIADTFEKLIPASEFLNGNPKEKQSNQWWIISAGEDPVREKVWNEFKNSNTVGFYWNETGDLDKLTDKQIIEKFKQIGIKKRGEARNWGPARDIKKVKKNDILFVKLGKRGFYGIGKATDTYQYNTNQSYHHTIPVQWITIQPYKKPEGYSLNLQLNNTMTSIPDKNQEPELVKYYENAINGKTLTFEEENQNMEKYSEYLDILDWEKNLILYGPPGTGKTYTANKIAQEKIRKNKQMTWKNCALSILLDNKGMALPYKKITQRIIKEGLRTSDIPTPEETVRRDIDEDIKNNSESFFLKSSTRGEYGLKIPLTFMDATKLVLTVNDPLHYDRITEICKNKNLLKSSGQTKDQTLNAVITVDIKCNGDKSSFIKISPGTYSLKNRVGIAKKQYIKKITFHQSYSYEEFMEGIKAKIKKEDETSETSKRFVDYVVEPGIFKSFCESAKKDMENSYVMIIDEINRGNTSKIFGELITIIEKDKRNDPVTLPYSREESFSVPDNVYIIGTMNTADRSIALLDIALKRRFGHTEIMPDSSVLKDKNDKPSIVDSINLQDLLNSLNKKIREIGMRERQIGHSYLMNGEYGIDKIKDLRLAFVYDILPLLRDFSLGDDEELKRIISEFFIDWDTKNVKDELKKGGNDGNESFKAEIKSFLKWADSESSDTQNGE